MTDDGYMSEAGRRPPDGSAPLMQMEKQEHLEPLDELAGNAAARLVNSALVLMAALPRGWSDAVSIDIAGLALARTTPLTTRINGLSHRFLSYVFDPRRTAPAARRALTQAIQEAEQASRALARAIDFEWRSISESDTRALEEVGEFLRVAGLASHERLCRLTETAGGAGVAWYPVEPEGVTAALLNKLYRRVEFFAQRNRLGGLENNAAIWYFDNHAVPHELTGMNQRQLFRKGEWCLVERRSLAFRVPFLDAFIDHAGLQHLDAREQQLARALQRRVPGVFEVMRAAGNTATLRDHVTGRDFEVRGHSFPLERGQLVLGSLVPSEAAWQFSPGRVVFDPDRPDVASEFLATFPETIPAGLRIELMISSTFATFDRIPPRDLPPFRSAAEARTVYADMVSVLLDAGYARAPAGWEALRGPDGIVDFAPIIVTDPALLEGIDPSDRPHKIDAAVTEWLAATRAIILESDGGSRRPPARGARQPGPRWRGERS